MSNPSHLIPLPKAEVERLALNQPGTLPNTLPVNDTSGNWVPLDGKITACIPNTATRVDFREPVNHLLVFNKTTADTIYFMADQIASAGAIKLAPGASISLDCPCQYISILAPNADVINGINDGNILVLGWR